MNIDINLLKQGDNNEFERFVHKYRLNAENFAMNILHDNYLAQDIVQDSFAKIYVYRDMIDDHKSLKSYFFSIIRNKAIDHLRKNKREMSGEFEIESSASPENILLRQERNEEINEHINNLKPVQRYVIYLYVYENLNYKEIAEVLGKTEGQIKSILFRARKKIKRNISLLEVSL